MRVPTRRRWTTASGDGGQVIVDQTTPNTVNPTVPAYVFGTYFDISPYRYDPTRGQRSGLFNPSNIVRRGDYFYTMMTSAPQGEQRAGVCLMRTDRLDDPASWRGWPRRSRANAPPRDCWPPPSSPSTA